MRRSAWLLAIPLAGLLAACGSSPGRSSMETAGESSPAKPTSGVPVACDAATLRAREGQGGVAAGHAAVTVVLTNSGSRTCSASGYPAIALSSSSGTALPRPKPGSNYIVPALPQRRIDLRPGRSASFEFGGSDGTGMVRACAQAAVARIVPPGTTTPMTLRIGLPDCGDLVVSPVYPGSGKPA